MATRQVPISILRALVAACGTTGFVACKPVTGESATTSASAVVKIMLQQSISHTLVHDKDSNFLGIFRQVVDLLQINCHTLSIGSNDGMLVERVNRFINKGLWVTTNERGSIRDALEAILFLIYAWNSLPIPGTNLLCSLVAVDF